MLSKLISVLKARWFITLLGAILLSLLIWFIGPLIAVADVRPLDGAIVRLLCAIAIFIVWGLANLFAVMRAKSSNDKFIDEIAEGAAGDQADAVASADEIAVLKERLQTALGTLKRTKLGGKGGRQHLYELPWYVVIGPPGAGKTTALVNSGLDFPLAEQHGRDAVHGVGGTRNCDWWFTNEAVLLDTAGRYATQDSQQAVDRAAWLGFLGLLKKYRPRQPINGAIIAVSVSDLLTLTDTERLALGRSIRQRIRELHDELGIRFPIYVLFTKADLLAGFVEFFDDLGRGERDQVWGVTLDLAESGEEKALDSFAREFDALVQRLNDRAIERMHQEPDLQRRGLLYTFPSEVAAIKRAATDFMREVFQPSRFEERPLIRGAYFTSGTQEGTPIDRIMGALSAHFRLERPRLAAFSGAGRSYFLTSLLRDVIFPEASLVGANRAQERRYLWLQRGALAAAVLAVVVLSGLWLWSYSSNKDLLARVDASAQAYRKASANISEAAIGDTNLAAILPALNILRQMPRGYAERGADVPTGMTFGLYQGGEIGAQAVAAYRRALNRMMLPRMLLRLEQQIIAKMRETQYLYEALRVYLMLGAQGPMDADLVHEWMRLDWATLYPGQQNAQGREALLQHLDALTAEPVQPIALNGPVVEQARRALAAMSLADRIYTRIRQSQAARQLPEWRVIDHAGAAGGRVFVRKSGHSLADGISGFYTYKGFHDVFLPAVGAATREMGKERWILGGKPEAELSAPEARKLEGQVTSLYLDDYAARWDGLLSDITITPFGNLPQAVEVLNVLSGPSSPFRNLLVAVVHETELAKKPPAAGAAGALQKAADAAKAVAEKSAAASRLAAIVGAPAADGAPPGQVIEDRYRKLNEFVLGKEGAPPPMEDVLKKLNELYTDLNQMAGSLSREDSIRNFWKGGAGRSVVQQLNSAASRVPPPVNGWLSTAAQASSTVVVRNARSQLNELWTSQVLPTCRAALEGRYPVHRDGGTEVALADFKRLFAPGGLIDGFFEQHLKPFVDTSARPWRWQRVDNVDLGISARVLQEFEDAAAIKGGFFSGGTDLKVQFDLTPAELDAGSNQVLLDIDGQRVSYNHGPQRATQLQWPGPNGAGGVRLVFFPSTQGEPVSKTWNGPWALFRVLGEARIQGSGQPDRFTFRVGLGGRSATFELRANSVVNPFTLRALGSYRCPSSL